MIAEVLSPTMASSTPSTPAARFVSSDIPRRTPASELVDGVRRRLAARRTIASTYRLQFHSDFTLRGAEGLADYFAELGVSHVYSSPQTAAKSGSRHGYDVVDPTRLNPELGSEQDGADYRAALQKHGLGQILDIVPNHMSVAGSENPWWMDVLTHGPASRFAHFFDIDWQPSRRELEGRVLLPVLGDLYGKALEGGGLVVRYQDGSFSVECPGARLPLDPKTWPAILELATPMQQQGEASEADPETLEFRSILSALNHLPERTNVTTEAKAERYRETIVIQGRLRRLAEQSPALAAGIEQALRQINGTPGESASFDRLDHLLDAQVYHLVHWKAGSDELNYRRFFDVTELAAICTEHPDVFEATHGQWLAWAVAQQTDGFRIDHVDGLFDPEQYLWRLQWGYLREVVRDEVRQRSADSTESGVWQGIEAEALQTLWEEIAPPPFAGWAVTATTSTPEARPAPGSSAPDSEESRIARRARLPLPVLVEKILGRSEPLPGDWPVLGTTGYDFLSQLNGLLVDPAGLRDIEKHYARFTKFHAPIRDIVHQCKRLILTGPMQSEIQLLASRLDRLSSHHRESRDYTLLALRGVIRELIACFPFYRTYITPREVSETDRRIIARAAAEARQRNPILDGDLFAFLRDVLIQKRPPQLDEEGQRERDLFIGRFQQVTSPVAAKGVEDTVFYRHLPLSSLCEVGADPAQPLTSRDEFHRQNAERQVRWPRTMLGTTTHDTKRTEDVRARLSVLSEIPGAWRSAVERWARWNRKHRRDVEGEPAPSRNDEWLFYQTLLGVWPLEPLTPKGLKDLTERLVQYMQKATHEAKLRTSWIHPNAEYDDAVAYFVRKTLEQPGSRFVQDVAAFAEQVVPCGLYSSCSQTLLKLMSPGIPDIYQGQETWDFSLVDPDNRRPVDYAARRQQLASLRSADSSPEQRLALARELARTPSDPRLKLSVVSTGLRLRRELAAPADDYIPLEVQGDRADHLLAFARVWRQPGAAPRTVLTVAPRWIAKLTIGASSRQPCGAVWGETRIDLGRLALPEMQNLFTGARLVPTTGALRVADLLADFPVALLASEAGSDKI